MIYDKIVESPLEPLSTNVIWLRPTEKGFGFYRYKNGRWEVLRLMKDEGTSSPDDDEPYDLDGVGAKKLSELEDVSLNTLTDGQVLKYNGSSWENEDDEGGTPGPGTIGTEQIIDDSVEMEDLNSSVRDKIQKTYHQDDESLHMDYDIATQT